MKKEEYLTIPQLAKMLGISRIAIYKKVKKGEIEAVKIGRTYAIPKKNSIDILGEGLNAKDKEGIKKVVKKAIEEYGEALKRLGSE